MINFKAYSEDYLLDWRHTLIFMVSKRLSLAAMLIAIAACSSNPNEHKPSPLPLLPAKAEQVKVQKIKDWRIGKGLQENEVAPQLVTQNNTLYAASHNGVVMAIEANLGKQWQQNTQLQVTGLDVAYGRVVLSSAKGELNALDAQTGQQIWQKTLNAPILAAAAQTAERVIVQSNDGKVYGLEAKTGNTIWVFDTPTASLSLRGYASPLVIEDQVIVAGATGKIFALEAQTGIALWEIRVASSNGRSELERMIDVDGQMLVDSEQKLYVAS
ncbi:MAG TPA: PQQ-binding-like beta-propeller repeat protein, partial [Agitococcus sp.]|nr:PQQ-binding-like beta-propeller repeat protein [Agitococcus sp.]